MVHCIIPKYYTQAGILISGEYGSQKLNESSILARKSAHYVNTIRISVFNVYVAISPLTTATMKPTSFGIPRNAYQRYPYTSWVSLFGGSRFKPSVRWWNILRYAGNLVLEDMSEGTLFGTDWQRAFYAKNSITRAQSVSCYLRLDAVSGHIHTVGKFGNRANQYDT